MLQDSDLLEGLADVSLDRGRGVGVVRGSDSSSVLASVELGERSDTNVLSEVDVSSDGGYGRIARMRRQERRKEKKEKGKARGFRVSGGRGVGDMYDV